VGGRVTIDKTFAETVTYPVPLLWELIQVYGFNYDQTEGIMAALNGESGRIFQAPEYTLVVDRTQLIITPRMAEPDAVTITTPNAQAVLGGLQLTIAPWTASPAEAGLQRRWVDSGPSAALLDAAQLAFPLTWRRWREGDFFYPLGMDHRKKVSDFLIDRKVSVADKPMVTVLESGGDIVWVVGHRIDNRFRITPATQEALRLTLDQYFM
jgi:tRNA(Ile)-lysidine synthase